MIIIKEYIIAVIGISVIGSLVSMLSPDGESGGLSRNIRLIVGICVAFVCINPIKDIVIYINELDVSRLADIYENNDEKYEEYFDKSYSAAEIENLKTGIKQLLSDRYDIDDSECSVAVKTAKKEDGESVLEKVYITLYGTAIFKNTNEIEERLGDILDCEIVMMIG